MLDQLKIRIYIFEEVQDEVLTVGTPPWHHTWPEIILPS